jgi:uncharacterized OB-fold protein
MSSYVKPLPVPDDVTRPYWESLKQHQMKIQRCPACNLAIFYPRGLCPQCWSSDLVWEPVSGRGTVHALAIVHANRAPGFADEVPYVVALVELDEGVRLMSNVVDVQPDPEHVTVGMPVELVYDDVTEEITLPKFRPRRA